MEATLYDRWEEYCDGIHWWSRRFWTVGAALIMIDGLAAALVLRLSSTTGLVLDPGFWVHLGGVAPRELLGGSERISITWTPTPPEGGSK